MPDPTPFIVHQPASGAAHSGSMEDCAVCASVARERLRVFDAGEPNELRNAVREALLAIQLWREGSYQRLRRWGEHGPHVGSR